MTNTCKSKKGFFEIKMVAAASNQILNKTMILINL